MIAVLPPNEDRPTWHIADTVTRQRGEFRENGEQVSGDLKIKQADAKKLIDKHLLP